MTATGAPRVLIFDCDGVLADTEFDGHLPAFNATFAEFGVPLRWSRQTYRELLRIGGGKERLRSVFTPQFVAEAGLPADDEGQRTVVAAWHRRKSELFRQLVLARQIPARPGVYRIVSDAVRAGWTLAVASTSAEASVRAVLESVVGSDNVRHFKVYAGDVVPRKKPAPDIYQLAVRDLAVDPADVLVIEDTPNGLRAALAAGLRCLVTAGDDAADGEAFEGAALAVTSLGDPDGERVRVIRNRSSVTPRGWLELGDLAALIGGHGDE
ncbi:HAD-IA family hydrolase [Rhizomonospora bruguierae]|uniref:HAD-IA family hydrolase n=1 Tax=Rhizomonospora bruguierae TaxID=1581705 RepID=UPI001BCE1EF5|nr:HAD-IA family hydrolase [Micromonospora sp. NBRC 107566]